MGEVSPGKRNPVEGLLSLELLLFLGCSLQHLSVTSLWQDTRSVFDGTFFPFGALVALLSRLALPC